MKKVPRHRFENEEREFWSKADSTDFIDWKGAKRVTFFKLKPSLRAISLRLQEMMIEELKLLANKMDVPYQTLIKIYLSERIRKELESANAWPSAKGGRSIVKPVFFVYIWF
jgi:predicted DNA binding CopG/RHH family protein